MLKLNLLPTRKFIFCYFRTVSHDGDVCNNIVTKHCNFVFRLIHNLKKNFTRCLEGVAAKKEYNKRYK